MLIVVAAFFAKNRTRLPARCADEFLPPDKFTLARKPRASVVLFSNSLKQNRGVSCK
jgi:hypothetical protein